jgi:asparagine synthase (glutamine-hydrolysing)
MFRNDRADIFSPDFLRNIDSSHPDILMQTTWQEAGNNKVIDKLLFFDWKFVLADTDLRKVSRMCQTAGIEVHYPMLDSRVIDLSLEIPDTIKISGQNLRHFFKQAMSGFLPREVINKPKHGFGLPFGLWLKEPGEFREQMLGALRALAGRGMFRQEFLDSIVAQHQTGHPGYYGYVIWDLAMLEFWLQAKQLNV